MHLSSSFNLSEPFTIFFGGFSICFTVIAFNLKTGIKGSPSQMGYPFSRPSVFPFQNQYFNNNVEQNFFWRLGYEQQWLPGSQSIQPSQSS